MDTNPQSPDELDSEDSLEKARRYAAEWRYSQADVRYTADQAVMRYSAWPAHPEVTPDQLYFYGWRPNNQRTAPDDRRVADRRVNDRRH